MRTLGVTVALALTGPPVAHDVSGHATHDLADRVKAPAPSDRDTGARHHRRHHHRVLGPHPVRHTNRGPSPVVIAQWTRVAVCEEGAWVGYSGPQYPDSLGINAANWYANQGGTDESIANQIEVAQDVEGSSFVPDQNGCAAW